MEINIKGLIASHNMKYKDVANRTGIPLVTFYRKLGKNSFSIAETAKIVDILGMRIALVRK